MATLPANDAVEPVIAGEIILVPVSAVRRGERLRPIDPVWAKALGSIMVREGQQTPIEICREPGSSGWLLVAGGHRHAGAEFAGMELIEAREVSGSKAHRRMREITENLWRRDLDPIDRASFVAELVQLKRAQAGITDVAHRESSVPRAVKAEAERTCDTMSQVYGWTAEVAEELGFAKRTLQRDLSLYRGLRPSVVALLRENRHPILKNAAQLRQLANLEPSEQERVAARMIDQGYGAPRSVGDAVLLVRGTNRPVADPDAKRLSAFTGAFQRMGVTEKKGALAELAPLLPAGFKIVEGQEAAPRESASLMPEKELAELKDGLRAAFEVLLKLYDGSDLVEDNEISDAKGKVQLALMAVNCGLVPGAQA